MTARSSVCTVSTIMMKRLLVVLTFLLLVNCDESPANTELCRDVYTALCTHSHDSCGLEHLDECISYYFESCRVQRLHSGITPPTDEEEQACIDAIPTLECGDLDPGKLEVCSFLREPPETDGDGDGDTDGDADADAEGDADADADEETE